MQGRGGVREGMMGKEILKKDGGFPFQYAHRMQSRFFKDSQLRCKCSPEGGWIKRSPVSFTAQSVSVVRSAGDS